MACFACYRIALDRVIHWHSVSFAKPVNDCNDDSYTKNDFVIDYSHFDKF
jgi:hypothetical protein